MVPSRAYFHYYHLIYVCYGKNEIYETLSNPHSRQDIWIKVILIRNELEDERMKALFSHLTPVIPLN